MNLNLKALARKVIALINHGLTDGVGNPRPGEMCVEAAICYALEESHGDNPSCVDDHLRSFKIGLNDCSWSTDKARARGLKRLAIASLGSDRLLLSHYPNEKHKFNAHVYLRTVNVIAPQLLRIITDREECVRNDFEILATKCEKVKEPQPAKELMRELYKLMDRVGTNDRMEQIQDFARQMSGTISSDSVASAMESLGPDNGSKLPVRFYDSLLTQVADFAVEALQKLESPGCEHLNLIKS